MQIEEMREIKEKMVEWGAEREEREDGGHHAKYERDRNSKGL